MSCTGLVALHTLMEPLVPLMTASFGSRAAIEKVQKAILFLENFITTTTDSSTPDKHFKTVNHCKAFEKQINQGMLTILLFISLSFNLHSVHFIIGQDTLQLGQFSSAVLSITF